MAYNDELKDKIPPHNEDAERATLGAMLLDPEAVPAAQLSLSAEDFYTPANGRIFKAILNLSNKGMVKADIITLADELRQTGELDAAGGEAYIASLTNVVPTSANIDYYVKIVQDCSLRRAIINVSEKLKSLAYDVSADYEQVLNESQQLLFDVAYKKKIVSYRSLHDITPTVIDNIIKLRDSAKEYTGIPSGFTDLDRYTSGFQNSELIILGARPSIGKTAIALNMASHIAIKEQRRVAFFSLETSDKQLTMRILSSEARVNGDSLRKGYVSSQDVTKLIDAVGRIEVAKLYFVDMPNMKLMDLRTLARRLCAIEKVDIIFIDYLGLISTEKQYLNRYEQVTEISRSLKSLARELNKPLIVLSQLGRGSEGNEPTLASLRDSGAIEQDADVVMFLHRERTKEGEAQPENMDAKLILAKQRNGPTGNVKLQFIPKYTEFTNTTNQSI